MARVLSGSQPRNRRVTSPTNSSLLFITYVKTSALALSPPFSSALSSRRRSLSPSMATSTLTMLSNSTPDLNAPSVPSRIKRKPPPIVDVSERYPSPDPLDPFAPLWALRTRTQSTLNGSTTSLLPYANPYGSQETLELSNGAGVIQRQRPNSYAFDSSAMTGNVSTLGSPISPARTPSPTVKKIPQANPIVNSKIGHYRPHSQINPVGSPQAYPRIEQHASYILTVDPIQSDLASPKLDSSVVPGVDSIHSPTETPLEGALAGASDSGSESDSVSAASFKFKRQDTFNTVLEYHRTQTPPPSNAQVNVDSITNPVVKPQRNAANVPSSPSRFTRFLLPKKRATTMAGARPDEAGPASAPTWSSPVQSDATPQMRMMGTNSVLEKRKGLPKIGKASISAPQALMSTADWDPKNSTGVRGVPSPLGNVNEYATSAILVSGKSISLVPQVSNRDLEMESRESGDDVSRRRSASEILTLDSRAIRKKLETGDTRSPKRYFGEGYITGWEAIENMDAKPAQGSDQRTRTVPSIQQNEDQKPNMGLKLSKRRSLPIPALPLPSPALPSSHTISNTSIVNISMPIPAPSSVQHTSEGVYNSPRPAPPPPAQSSSIQSPTVAAEKGDTWSGHCESGISCHPHNHPIKPQNPSPSTEYELPTAAQTIQAASLPLIREDGSTITFGSLFTAHRTIVVFLRHFLCPYCQDYMSSLKTLVKPEMLWRGSDDTSQQSNLVRLVVISSGAHALIRKYRKIFGLPFLVYTDPNLGIYKALGMGKGAFRAGHVHLDCVPPSPEKTLGDPAGRAIDIPGKGTAKRGSYVKHSLLGGIAMVIVRSIKVGMSPWADGGDITQLGGEFVFGPG